MAAGSVTRDAVAAFLSAHHDGEVTDLEVLRGGYWSTAWAYRTGGRDLVARFGQMREGFEMDRAATAFRRPDLPVPEVLAVGDAFDGAYAISVRHRGRFLEEITTDEAPAAAAGVERMLAALRAAGARGGRHSPCSWYPPGSDPAESTWRRWLLEGLVDDPQRTVSGWRPKLADRPEVERLFVAGVARVEELAEACPERRDLVHGDLLHQNVLLAEDLSEVTAVFSWKCSVRGDFLFDVAWCTFWGAWHPGVAAIDAWSQVRRADDLTDADLVDASVRHHCYELQIGTGHLGWHAWTGDTHGLEAVAHRTAHILERGPLDPPTS